MLICSRIAALGLNGAAITVGGLVQTPDRLVGETQIVQEDGRRRWQQGDGPLNLIDCLGVIARLILQHAKQVPGVGVPRVALEDLSINPFGVGPTSGAVVCEAFVDQRVGVRTIGRVETIGRCQCVGSPGTGILAV